MLTDYHKTKRMGSTLKFLTRYAQEGDEFLDSTVNGDETWGFYHTPESKHQPLQWRHTFPQNQKIQNLNFSEENHGVRFLGQKKHSPGRLLAPWRNSWYRYILWYLDTASTSHSKQKEGNVVTRRVAGPRQRASPFRARHHCASGKIQVGYTGPSAVQSGPQAQRFPLVSSPKEKYRWEKSSTTMMRCKKKSWRGSKCRRQTSMTRGYRSWFPDLINVWTMPATMLTKLCTGSSFTVSLL